MEYFITISFERKLLQVKLCSLKFGLFRLEADGVLDPGENTDSRKNIEMMQGCEYEFFSNVKASVFFSNFLVIIHVLVKYDKKTIGFGPGIIENIHG